MLKIIKLILFICLIQIVLCKHKNCDHAIPNEPKPRECCFLPTIIPQNIRSDCVKQVGASNTTVMNTNLTAELKVAQCIFEKTNTTEGDSISEQRVKDVAKPAFTKFDDFLDEFEEAVEKCIKKENVMLNDFHKKVIEHNFTYDKGVNPVYALYISCIGTRMIGDCPDDYEVDTESCEKAREYLDDCNYQYPYPLFINFNKI